MKFTSEEGSSLILTIFAGLLGLVVVLGVLAASSLYIERKRLFTLADGAALAGAESFALEDVRIAGGMTTVRLTDTQISAAVTSYLAALPTGERSGVRLVSARTPDGVSAEVTLEKTWHPPVISSLLPAGIVLDVTALARTVFG